MNANERFLDRKATTERVSLSGSQIDRLEKAGKFPKRIPLSERRVAWLLSEVEAWMAARIAKVRATLPTMPGDVVAPA